MESTLPVFENIWLADDDSDDRELFGDVLHQLLPLCKLTMFTDGEELMQQLNGNVKPDILFLDINMPLRDGLDCLLQIRANRCYRNLPVIIFSSTTREDQIENSYRYGANLFYTKPSSLAELIAGLSTIFKMKWKDPSARTSSFAEYQLSQIFSPDQSPERD